MEGTDWGSIFAIIGVTLGFLVIAAGLLAGVVLFIRAVWRSGQQKN
ncbi:MAG: hypothetical protein M0R06_06530 [Sphaerochaeta sp.]|jgi:hypothetical protein|nr:hypothetical protein [Sphaerochaeta sp.]MDD4985132.1 hypothetical protein [Dehalococcoidales bacterium]